MITQEEFAAKQFASRHSDGTFNNRSVNNPKPANNSKPDTDRFKQFFMTCAHAAADLSRAKRSQVGAVLVRDGRVVATGYNGQPYGFDNCCETLNVFEDKLVTKPTVVHAELNVILFCAKHGISCDGGTLYITMSPCVNCAIALIQAGIKRVYYDTRYRVNEGIDLLKEAGIAVFQYTTDELEKNTISLSDLGKGVKAVVAGYSNSNSEYRAKLLALGVTRGTHVEIVNQSLLGDTIYIKVRESNIVLRRAEAGNILVRAIK